MKYEPNLQFESLKIIAETPEEERMLRELDETLNAFYGRTYQLSYRSGKIIKGEDKKAHFKELEFTVKSFWNRPLIPALRQLKPKFKP